jgi:lysophospholipase L1-like esterase
MKSPRQRSKILSPEAASVAGYTIAALSALVVVTCSSGARGPVSPRTGAVASAPAAARNVSFSVPRPLAAVSSEATPAVLSTASGPLRPLPPPGGGGGPSSLPLPPSAPALSLPRFRTALEELAAGRRTEKVRVLWLGDSHAAADFWPDAVRKPLQAKFGNAGPGFVYLGLGVYRHAGEKEERDGRWHTEPKKPSLWMRQGDGMFGLGGIRTVPDGETSRLTVSLAKDCVRGKALWDLTFRLPTNEARFRINPGSDVQSLLIDSSTRVVGSIQHVEWQTDVGATVTIDHAASEPQIFGAVVESSAPGVVVDTLGINGARIGTPLAWEEEPWLSEARRRNASLFVLAYGTNEAGDQVAPRRYGPELESLVARARKAAPDADCLVVGPTDRAGPGWISLPRVLEIDAVERDAAGRAGCAFFSALDAMGGEGSLGRWAAQVPPLAAPDRVHLTPRGYGTLGAKMVLEMVPDPPHPEMR